MKILVVRYESAQNTPVGFRVDVDGTGRFGGLVAVPTNETTTEHGPQPTNSRLA